MSFECWILVFGYWYRRYGYKVFGYGYIVGSKPHATSSPYLREGQGADLAHNLITAT